jgi:8-oxo-dGTP diphosphatase
MPHDCAPIDVDWRLHERRHKVRPDGWQSSGGVVVDLESGHVLIVKNRREHAEGRNGWTWPKGKLDKGEGPVFAALREISEEAGVMAEPLARLTCVRTKRATRHYFLFAKISDGLSHSNETLKVRWVSIREARRLLERKRDRQVLRDAKIMIRAIQEADVERPLLYSQPAACQA